MDNNGRIHHRREDEKEDKHLKIRNILNIIFMLGALIGVGVYFLLDQWVGTIVIVIAMLFKFAECSFRFLS